MRYVSLFSGIEAATVAWAPLGWECAAVAEIEPFPCAVLAHHYPDVPNLGDVTKIDEADILMLGLVDLLVFGSPCQDLSVAGKRAGLSGERSGLFHTAITILGWLRKHCGTRYALWENVPGAFSSNRGADFAVVVGELAGATVAVPPKGWGNEGALVGEKGMVEWATLDAQWRGVAQRRRRVFAFADFGDWAGRCPVLLEPESLRGDSAPSREAGEGATPILEAGARTGKSTTDRRAGLGIGEPHDPMFTLQSGKQHAVAHAPEIAHSLRADGFNASEDGTGRGTPLVPVVFEPRFARNGRGAPDEVCPPLKAQSGETGKGDSAPVVVTPINTQVALRHQAMGRGTGFGIGDPGDVQFTLQANHSHAIHQGMQVRRLTPRECERLQGFPDDYTQVPYRGKPASDGPRYKALGNSMAVPVMHWIGDRIALIEQFQ